MNKEQYNNIINRTLANEPAAQTEDSLATTRAIFNNMGVAIPNGSMKEVYEIIKTDDYMGWRACTREEAQQAANAGIAAIAIDDSQIVVLTAEDENVVQTDNGAVSEDDSNPSMEYYSYSFGGTTTIPPKVDEPYFGEPVRDKPFDPDYPYTINGSPNNLTEERYYALLDSYSYEVRNDMVFRFTFDEVDALRSYLNTIWCKTSHQQECEEVVEDIFKVVEYIISILPVPADNSTLVRLKSWLDVVTGAIEFTDLINSLNNDTVQEDINDIAVCIDALSHDQGSYTSTPKPNHISYTISLLRKSPTAGYEIKIENTEGAKDLYTLKKGAYEITLLAAIANAHSRALYKIAPEWTYYKEDF